ncbi:cytochrome c [Campylobacter blaseri]|uniref:Cytochrome c domain-containing protein n=1 Tax=Campylobacter blaseri TaxID=2042961 RepID=A0A2P8R0N9_9BACT|nr:c-type cytochrome [Campylobacter blaseri]PSM52058.1 hypothetical protein CQ405_05730 [Campylobacter blaseri]PSM53843.1 hypothetical protein CRN67_05730 [Campylobacter blaseri]QKF85604.1 cytochrome c [Campylobacter blaseri]
MQFFKLSFLISFLLLTNIYAQNNSNIDVSSQSKKHIKDENTTQPKKLSVSQIIGKQLFEVNCQKCHGVNGEKKSSPKSRRLSSMTSEEIYYTFKKYYTFGLNVGGSSRVTMEAVASKITLDELEQIISYIKNDDEFLKRNYKLKNTDISDKPTSQGVYIK